MQSRRDRLASLLAGSLLLCTLDVVLAAGDCSPGDARLERAPAEQKLILLERLANDSAPAQRIEQSGSTQAKALLSEAQHAASEARAAFSRDCFSDAAAHATAGLGAASRAFRSGPGSDDVEALRYQALHRSTSGLLTTVERQGEQITSISAAEVADMRRQIARAEQLAASGQPLQAERQLLPIEDRLQRRLLDIFNNKTLVYQKQFASPAEEYAYLLEYYRGYRLLLGGSETRSSETISHLLAEAELRADKAKSAATHANWDEALNEMQQAIEQCERISRIAGIF